MVENSYDSHIIWNKERKALRVYPSLRNKYKDFYSEILGNKLNEIDYKKYLLTDKILTEHDILFDEVDKAADKTFMVGTIFKIDNGDGTHRKLQVLMQRFNSNKFYETIRDVTDFYVSKNEALNNLAEVIETRKELNYKIRESLYAGQSRAFINKDS
jgi:hypothetical protein